MHETMLRTVYSFIRSFFLKNRPFYAHYGLTHRCNLKCRMCRVINDFGQEKELNINQIARLAEFLKSLGVSYISIGGGEPLLREDLPHIIQVLRKQGLMVRLLTNGTLAQQGLIGELMSAGLKNISISLDSLDGGKQDDLYNSKGVHKKIIESILLFKENFSGKGGILLLNTVVSPFNIEELPKLCDFAKHLGYYISFVPIEENGLAEWSFQKQHNLLIKEVYDELISIKKRGRSAIFNSVNFLEKSCEFLITKRHNWNCDAGTLYFSIRPNGGISICHKFPPIISAYSSNEKSFFRSKEYEKARKDAVNNCSGCMRPCWAELSFMRSGNRAYWEICKAQLRSHFHVYW